MTVNLGLIGCGRIGQVHADSINANADARLVRVFDPVEASARTVADRFDTSWTTRVEQIIDDPGIDAVVVASPTPTHVELTTQAVEAGKAVLCEKPIDLDVATVDACRERLGERTDRVLVGFNRRFDPSFADVHARVRAGEIGGLEQLIIVSRDPAPPPAGYVAGSGGLFKDMTIHDFDMARFFLGEVVEVTAFGSNLIDPGIASAGDIDGAVVLLRGASGALCTITNSRRCSFGYDQRLEAFGERGMLSAANQLPTTVRFSGAEHTEAAAPYLNFFLDRYTPAYRAELAHFLAVARGEVAPSPGFGDGRDALVLAEAAGKSLRTGAAVRVDGSVAGGSAA